MHKIDRYEKTIKLLDEAVWTLSIFFKQGSVTAGRFLAQTPQSGSHSTTGLPSELSLFPSQLSLFWTGHSLLSDEWQASLQVQQSLPPLNTSFALFCKSFLFLFYFNKIFKCLIWFLSTLNIHQKPRLYKSCTQLQHFESYTNNCHQSVHTFVQFK